LSTTDTITAKSSGLNGTGWMDKLDLLSSPPACCPGSAGGDDAVDAAKCDEGAIKVEDGS